MAGLRRRVHRALLMVFQHLPRRVRVALVHVLAPGFTVGAICRLEREDGALLLVRHVYRRRWGLPGGLLQRGEAPEDAVVREVAEEVGVAVEVVGEPAVVVDPDPRRVDVVFRARLRDPADAARVAPRSPEIVDVGWFRPDDLPELQFEAAGALATLRRHQRAWPTAPAGQ
jgi:ADP-ribose pyrophosphatase YjhB (NUDIX family)